MRPQKITFGEMRSFGVRGVLIYCADSRTHSWPSDPGRTASSIWQDLIYGRPSFGKNTLT
jgi:hypothetical protein